MDVGMHCVCVNVCWQIMIIIIDYTGFQKIITIDTFIYTLTLLSCVLSPRALRAHYVKIRSRDVKSRDTFIMLL